MGRQSWLSQCCNLSKKCFRHFLLSRDLKLSSPIKSKLQQVLLPSQLDLLRVSRRCKGVVDEEEVRMSNCMLKFNRGRYAQRDRLRRETLRSLSILRQHAFISCSAHSHLIEDQLQQQPRRRRHLGSSMILLPPTKYWRTALNQRSSSSTAVETVTMKQLSSQSLYQIKSKRSSAQSAVASQPLQCFTLTTTTSSSNCLRGVKSSRRLAKTCILLRHRAREVSLLRNQLCK